jgi:hypothetical protein
MSIERSHTNMSLLFDKLKTLGLASDFQLTLESSYREIHDMACRSVEYAPGTEVVLTANIYDAYNPDYDNPTWPSGTKGIVQSNSTNFAGKMCVNISIKPYREDVTWIAPYDIIERV